VEESIDTILQASRLKEEGKLQYIIVAGCLSQRYKQQDLQQSLPEVDAFIGVDELSQVDKIISQLKGKKNVFQVHYNPCFIYDEKTPRFLLTPRHYAYIKIAEGCNNGCSYCLIPRIKGRYRSRTIESIVTEVQNLTVHYPLKEIIIIAEDSTYYGMDLYGKPSLTDLLKRLVQLPWDEDQQIRILYTHPAHYNDQLIDLIAQNSIICPYLDIPLQHISDAVLHRMNRKVFQRDILKLIKKLRNEIPGLTLRTTFIVGFPGETDADFQELYDFVREYRFERVGAFPFYNEPECPASKLPNHVSEKSKKARVDKLMKLQQKIALENQLLEVGKIKRVLIDELSQKRENTLLGRSCAEAPEIDGYIAVLKGERQDIGRWLDVKITRAYPYYLQGEKVLAI